MPPRLEHRKSIRGCLRCKARKVKCNEQHPQCTNCQRHGVPCEYPPLETRAYTQPRPLQRRPPPVPRSLPSPELASLPSKTDLRLMHHYVTATARTMGTAHIPNVGSMWHNAVPEMAFEYQPLLHTLLAVAAAHRAALVPAEADHLRLVHRAHIDRALHQHRSDLANNNVTESLCMNTILLSMYALMLRSEPSPLSASASGTPVYKPPLLWLNMARGIRAVISQVYHRLVASRARISPLLVARPIVHDSGGNASVYRTPGRPFEFLLRCNPDPRDTPELLGDYDLCIRYLENMYKAVRAGESAYDIRKRFSSFAPMAPQSFMVELAAKRPRALVILAYLFALVKGAEDIWWLRGVP
ncbi:hypothetical protein BO71DRAFT_489607, partial [Aspergillus ellipticus CBS 707.79]